ncbi:MAG: undecaprenyl-diphosphate phosphatase [Chloroflexi bacterium]|nr:undecaprenyl-diphosphate phosphatase [Chloroflexota bacterium]
MSLALLLGLLQGVTEWVPVSSEGVVAATYSFFLKRPLEEAVAYALWLHVGTLFSAIIVFRRELMQIARELLILRRRPSPLTFFLIVSSLVSGAVGLPLLLLLRHVPNVAGAGVMAVVGSLMLVTGGVQLRRPQPGTRHRDELSYIDSTLAGVAQGIAALPGLSRSGLTIAVLLSRRIDRREALALSFLMSVPASLGAGVYSAATQPGLALTGSSAAAILVAFLVGLLTIRGLLAVAGQLSFAWIVLLMGLLILGGAAFQIAL